MITLAGEFIVKAGWILGPRQLDEYELVYFPLASNTTYSANMKSVCLTQPSFILTRPQELHSYYFDPDQPTRHLFFHFKYNRNAGYSFINSFLSSNVSCIPATETTLAPIMLKHIMQLADESNPHWQERCHHLFLSVLGELSVLPSLEQSKENSIKSKGEKIPSQIYKALEYMENHLDCPLSISSIASYVGWTHEHLTRLFVQHIGLPPNQVILEKRIHRAAQLLIRESWPIKKIAYCVGFQDEHYFSRCFKKIKGVTASQYRNHYTDPRMEHLSPVPEIDRHSSLNQYIFFSGNENIK